MENNVIISIQGKQSFEAQDDDTIELVTEGCLCLLYTSPSPRDS